MDLPAWLTPHTVTVEPRTGVGAGGQAVYGPPVTTRAMVEHGSTNVRDAAGARILSTAAVFLPLSALPDLPPGSRVTLPGDDQRDVITVERNEHSAATPNHYEVRLR